MDTSSSFSFTRQTERPEHLRLLLENSRDVMLEIDAIGLILYASPNARRVLGLEPDELVGTSIFERVHPDDLSEAREQFVTPAGWVTCRVQAQNGEWRWMETHGHNFTLPDGSTHGVLSVRDITHHKQTEIAFYENERVLSTLLRTLPGMAYRCRFDSNRTMEYVSDGCASLTGFTRDDLVGNRRVAYGNLIVEEDREMVVRELETAVRNQRSYELVYRVTASDRCIKWVSERGQGIFDKTGGGIILEGLITDITERKAAEEVVVTSERTLRAILDQSFQYIGLLDIDGRLLRPNKTSLDAVGVRLEDVQGKFFWETPWWAHSPLEQERLREAVARAAMGECVRFQTTHPAANGELLTIDFSLKPARDEHGRVMALIPEGRDITAHQKAEQERASLEAQLRQSQKLEAAGTLAGGIAHDFNNILGCIMAYTELAELELERPNEVRSHLAQVSAACVRAKELVQQILTFSRQQKQERKPLRLTPVVREAMDFLRSTIPRTIDIETHIDVDTPVILADPTQVYQVLMNLCTNAAHAMRETTGRLAVRVSACEIDENMVRRNPCLRQTRYARLSVTDTGHGMDGETMKRIFEPFFTTKGPREGTGLGLPVVHGIVKEHEGAIEVKSQPGQGTTFEVYFPAFQSTIKESQSTGEPPPRGHGERVLIVDDEPALCMAARLALERLGYDVTTQTNPDEALARFRAAGHSFDLIITDLAMPRMSGIELARQILRLRPGQSVLLASGFSSTWTREKVRDLGIRDLILKPFNMAELGHAVKSALESLTLN